jgi:hypothetical protein
MPFLSFLSFYPPVVDKKDNCIVTDGHVRIAVGRNFADCTPVKGTYKGSGEHTREVRVNIENGKPRQTPEQSGRPAFPYIVQKTEAPVNSYRKYLEMQQQQQQ